MLNKLAWLLALIIVLFAAVFGATNKQMVTFNYFVGTTDTSLSYLLLASFLLGVLLVIIPLLINHVRLRVLTKKLQAQKQALLTDQEVV